MFHVVNIYLQLLQRINRFPLRLVFLWQGIDNQGKVQYNMDLSHRRAAAVRDVLVKTHGIDINRLGAVGMGPFAPVASNRTEEGRAKNRRVELVEF